MNRQQKEQQVSSLSTRLKQVQAVVLAEYRGLKVSEITEIRKEVRKNSGEFRVVKNRLVKKAITELPQKVLSDHLKGPIAMAVSSEEISLFKLITKFATTYPALKLKAGFFDGKLLTVQEIETLSRLPSKEEMLAKMLGSLLAPATNIVRVLQAVPEKLVRVLKAISEKQS